MTEKGYEIKSFASDPFATQQRTDFAFNALRDIQQKANIEAIVSRAYWSKLLRICRSRNLPKDPE